VVEGDMKEVAFDWSATEGLTEDLVLNGLSGKFLIVKPEALFPGERRTFSVKITNTTSLASSEASLEVAVNESPRCAYSNGEVCLSASPVEGFSYGDTEFSVEAKGWEVVEVISGTLVIKYRFGYCVKDRCVNQGFQESASFVFKSLPPGDDETNKVAIRVCAVDVFVASTVDLPLSESCQTTDIVVKPSETRDVNFGRITQTLALSKNASAANQLEAANTVVSIVRSNGNGTEETNEQKTKAREAISQAVDVIGDVLEAGNVPREVIEQITHTLTVAGENAAADGQVSVVPKP
jgi:hypothetical protein